MGWTLIQHTALTSSAASVTLGSGGTIPQTYKTLKLVISARSDRAAQAAADTTLSINGATTSFSARYILGTGAAAASYTETNYIGPVPAAAATTSTFGNSEITLPNYTSNTNKPYGIDAVQENNATGAFQMLLAGLRSNNDAITSITVNCGNSANFVQHSTFTLYGLS